jgi:DEAD/DEAH box helicase
MADVTAAERKRKRLEAWRKRQQQEQLPTTAAVAPPPPILPTVKITLSNKILPKKKTNTSIVPVVNTFNVFGDAEDDEKDPAEEQHERQRKPMLDWEGDEETTTGSNKDESSTGTSRKRRRWDVEGVGDALDSFMERLQEGALGPVTALQADVAVHVNVGGSMMRLESTTTNTTQQQQQPPLISGQVVTAEQLELWNGKMKKDPDAHYAQSDWESEGGASEVDTEDEEEEVARRKFLQALQSAPVPTTNSGGVGGDGEPQLNTAAEVRTEKHRREDRLKELEHEAEAARQAAASEAEFGRLYNDGEDGVMEEAERNFDAAMAVPDALEVLAELNKKKELKSVDHSQIDYIKFRKNLYIVPRALANLSSDEVINRRAKLKIRVRGKAAPVPVSSWIECGLSERIIKILESQGISYPYAVQSQCIPCIMAGRDVIGIAKTGSGKTLAYLLPLLRHIGDQPPLGPQESGPIGLILAPARELAAQIHSVCKIFCKSLGLK